MGGGDDEADDRLRLEDVGYVACCAWFSWGFQAVDWEGMHGSPGQPSAAHQLCSTVVRHWSQEKAPRASPLKTSSRSKMLRSPSIERATAVAFR